MFNKAKTQVSHLRVSPGVLFSMMKFLTAVNLIAQAEAHETNLLDEKPQQTGNHSVTNRTPLGEGPLGQVIIAVILVGYMLLSSLGIPTFIWSLFYARDAEVVESNALAGDIDIIEDEESEDEESEDEEPDAPEEKMEMEAEVSLRDELYKLTKSEKKLLPKCDKLMLPRKNGHSTKRPFALQNIPDLNIQV